MNCPSGSSGLRPAAPTRLQSFQLFALVGMSPIAAVAIILLQRLGYVAQLAFWVIPVVFVVATAASAATFVLSARVSARWMLHVRAAVQAAAVVGPIYATGWGPTLAVGLVLVGQETIAVAGSGAVNVVTGWSLVFLAAGETALALGWTPSQVPVPEVHGLAVLMGIGLVFVFRAHAIALRHEEVALEQLESRERRFRSLVQNAHDLLLVMDLSGRVTYASPSSSNVLGYDADDLLGWRTHA